MTECWIMRRSRFAREIMATWPAGKRAAYGDLTPEAVAEMRERARLRMERGRWAQVEPPTEEPQT